MPSKFIFINLGRSISIESLLSSERVYAKFFNHYFQVITTFMAFTAAQYIKNEQPAPLFARLWTKFVLSHVVTYLGYLLLFPSRVFTSSNANESLERSFFQKSPFNETYTALSITNDSLQGLQGLSRACGTASPSSFLLEVHRAFQQPRLAHKRASPETTKYVVNVFFHVITTRDQAQLVKPFMIANQFGVLQEAYASSNISFLLTGVDYSVNDTWASDQADRDMKSALRRGNYSSLNIYFQSNLSSKAYNTATQLLGYCTLPTNITYNPCAGCLPAEYPDDDYRLDGCNVLAGTMPGGPVVGYNSGKTAIHEIGHWFGLLHTFQDASCNHDDPGDFIDDTPQQSVSTDGCPESKDSCPDCPGLDPIHNFMDYSIDACYENFTPEQISRMQSMYKLLRADN